MKEDIKTIEIDEITPEQALNTLYNATRQIKLEADGHELLKKLKEILEKAIIKM